MTLDCPCTECRERAFCSWQQRRMTEAACPLSCGQTQRQTPTAGRQMGSRRRCPLAAAAAGAATAAASGGQMAIGKAAAANGRQLSAAALAAAGGRQLTAVALVALAAATPSLGPALALALLASPPRPLLFSAGRRGRASVAVKAS